MDLNSVGRLISAISVHYPAMKKHCTDEAGKIDRYFAEEWHRHLKDADFNKCLDKLDKYLKQGNKYAPEVTYFLQEDRKVEAFSFRGKRQWVVRKGRLFDQDGYEYADANNPYGEWELDPMGRLLLDGVLME